MNEKLHCGELIISPLIRRLADGAVVVTIKGMKHRINNVVLGDDELRFEYDGYRYTFHVLVQSDEVQLTDGLAYHRFIRREEGIDITNGPNGGELVSQMPGKVLKLLCEPEQRVDPGTPLIILEAMKMEHEICAPSAGVVKGYPCAEGSRVMPGSLLVDFELITDGADG